MLTNKTIFVFGMAYELSPKYYGTPISDSYGIKLQRWDVIGIGVRLCL